LPKDLPEVKRMVEEKKMTLNGIKKIFKNVHFITMKIQVIEKEAKKEDL